MDAVTLSDLGVLDTEALKALVIAQYGQLLQKSKQLASHTEQIEHLKLVIEKLRRMMFGAKSEKVSLQLEQLEFELKELETGRSAQETKVEAPAAMEPQSRPFRNPLPEHLPREVVTHLPQCDSCPECRGRLRQIGEDIAEQLERIPAVFKVIRHVRPKFVCARCERVVQASAPPRPIDRGLVGPASLAHVLVSKYGDQQPLYRPSAIYAREGVDLDRSTLAGWLAAAGQLLVPLVDALRKLYCRRPRSMPTMYR